MTTPDVGAEMGRANDEVEQEEPAPSEAVADETGAAADPSEAAAEPPPRWIDRLRPLGRPAAIYLAARFGVLLVAWSVSYIRQRTLEQVLGKWDSGAYINIATYGYVHRLPSIHASAEFWRVFIAFFPLYPLASRAVHDVTGLTIVQSAYIAAFIGGLAAAVLIWLLVRDHYGPAAADRATALVFCSPGAFVLSMTYSENMMLPLVAGCLLALGRRKWLLAGVFAAFATASDPAAIAIVVPCAWASLVAIRKDRDWRSLAAPVLSPIGILVYFGYLWAHIGTPFAWFEVEDRGWHKQLNPLSVYDELHNFFHFGFRYPNYTVMGIGFFVALALFAYAIGKRMEGNWLSYCIGVSVLALLTPNLGFTPRPLLHAFPLLAFLGVGLKRQWFTVALILSTLLLAAITVVSLGGLSLTP